MKRKIIARKPMSEVADYVLSYNGTDRATPYACHWQSIPDSDNMFWGAYFTSYWDALEHFENKKCDLQSVQMRLDRPTCSADEIPLDRSDGDLQEAIKCTS